MEDDALRADVASFAANLGLGTSQSGFNDADFRKKGPIKARTKASPSNAAGKENPSKSKKKKQERGKDGGQDGNAGSKKWPPQGKPRLSNLAEEKEAAVDVKRLSSSVEKVRFGKDVVHALTRWSGSGEKWYETAAEISSSVELLDVEKELTDGVVESKRTEAESLIKMVAVEFERTRLKDSDMRMILTARRSGTSGDKVAAMTVLIQENPVASLQTLDALLAMVTSKGGKRHALSAIDVLKELFIVSLLPDRKLMHFSRQPLAVLPETKEGTQLLLWWFWEDCIKQRYEKFVSTVIEGSKDILIFLKLKSIKTLYELLKAKPEQEKKLLSAIVNKLGDPERKAASNAGYHLSCLLTEHPNMTKIVLSEVELFVFRPNLGMRAIYYASVFMNMLRLNHSGEGPDIASKLIDMYFVMFKTITSWRHNKGENSQKLSRKQSEDDNKEDTSIKETSALDSRLISSLLTGVNKAFRFVTEDNAEKIVEEHTPALFRLAHSSNFNVGVQALLLLHQILAKHQTVSERFYRALYSVMLSPALFRSSKIDMYLSLVFKVLRSDVNISRTCAFIKRLMQVAIHQSPELSCAFLLLLSEVLKTKHVLWNFVLEPANQGDDQENFKDVELPDDRKQPANNDVTPAVDESDSDIHVDEEMAMALGEDNDSDVEFNSKRPAAKVQVIPAVKRTSPQAQAETNDHPSKGYDPRHRDPLYCKADETCWWELAILASHIHPSVSTMAKAILANASVVYSGDPIQDLAFTAFLDRFAEKKPKARRVGIDSGRKEGLSKVPVGMELASLAEDDVAPADLIFHRFYRAKAEAKGKLVKKKKKASEDFDEDMVGSDEEISDEDDVDDDDDEGDEGNEEEDLGTGSGSEEEIDRLLGENNDSEDGEFDIDDDDGDDSSDDDGFEMLDVDKANRKKISKNKDDEHDSSDDDEDELDAVFMDDKKESKKNKAKNKNRTEGDSDQKRKRNRSAGSKRKTLYASAEDYAHVLEGETSKKKKAKHQTLKRFSK